MTNLTQHQHARYARLRRTGYAASEALRRARAFDGNDYGTSTVWRRNSCVYNPPSDGNVRWVEDMQAAGLRFVGYADKIHTHIGHCGWFTHPDGFPDEALRGAVWQLPGRDHAPLFVYGYEDSYNPGAARVCFDAIPGEREDGYCEAAANDGCMEAARYADRMAEIDAEQEREWQSTWLAAQEAASAMQESGKTGRAALAAARAAARLCRAGDTGVFGLSPEDKDTLIGRYASEARRLWDQYQEQRAAAIRLIDDGKPGRRDTNLRDAWHDGYAV